MIGVLRVQSFLDHACPGTIMTVLIHFNNSVCRVQNLLSFLGQTVGLFICVSPELDRRLELVGV